MDMDILRGVCKGMLIAAVLMLGLAAFLYVGWSVVGGPIGFVVGVMLWVGGIFGGFYSVLK